MRAVFAKVSNVMPSETPKFIEDLVEWYQGVRRTLPWRTSRDPYRIWISEVMLQQTTVAAVIPYYDRFMNRFPTLATLAAASVEDVLEYWAGLGYYSRARNLHRAAQALDKKVTDSGAFPETHVELLEYSGFGDYTARAVSSLAFGERVGVLDGNVIRVISRIEGRRSEWWKPAERKILQARADAWAAEKKCDPSDINQAMMELGATICTPKSPSCMLCPLRNSCVAYQHKTGKLSARALPLPRPRRSLEIWHWKPEVTLKKGAVRLIKNDYAPFLKGHWILPGTVALKKTKPQRFHLRGSVTHHDIYVELPAKAQGRSSRSNSSSANECWIPLQKLKAKIPSSLIRKAIDTTLNLRTK